MEQKNSSSNVALVQSVDRAADILLAFTAVTPTLSLGELADIVGLPRSTTHRIARTLVDRGFLRQEDWGSYALGARLLELGGLVSNTSTLSRVSADVVRTIAGLTGETVLVAEVDWISNTVLITQRYDSVHELSVASPVGKRSGLGGGCIAKAVLAGLQPEEASLLIPKIHLVRRTKKSVTDTDELARQVERARKKGWATETDEYIEGVAGVAVPVALGGRPVGAISVIAPTARASQIRLSELGGTLSNLVREAMKSATEADQSGVVRIKQP